MTDYETGFDLGERQAFKDRRFLVRHSRPAGRMTELERGYWDGYCPRDAAWAMRATTESPAWWVKREEATA